MAKSLKPSEKKKSLKKIVLKKYLVTLYTSSQCLFTQHQLTHFEFRRKSQEISSKFKFGKNSASVFTFRKSFRY